jgi:hypothetical protein
MPEDGEMTMQHYSLETTQLSRLYTRLPLRERQQLIQQVEQYLSGIEERISRLLPVTVEPGGEGYIAGDDLTDMYGTGLTKEAAVEDYHAALLDAYESLTEVEGQLSESLNRRLETLRQIFEEAYLCLLGIDVESDRV